MTALHRTHPLAIAAIGILCATGFAQTTLDHDPAFAVLRDSASPIAARNAAADELVARAGRSEPARALIDILDGRESNPELQTLLLGAISRSWDPPGRLYPTLLELAEHSESPTAVPAVAAIGAYRTPVAAKALLSFCAAGRPPPVREAAFAALVRMTGRDDLGTSLTAWTDWVETHAKLRPPEWQSTLAEGVWHRALRLEADRSSLQDRAAEGYRRLYLALPPPPAPERSRLMIQLLRADQAPLRRLAFELLSREVSAGSPIDPAVCDAAMSLLEHPEAPARAKAAELVLQIGSPEARVRLSQALAVERDPAVATHLLAAAARWPDGQSRAVVLSWLSTPGVQRPAAVEAAYALLAEGLLTSDANRAAVLTAAREIGIQRLPAAGYRLLVELGDEGDRQAVTSLLRSDSAPTRASAAEALAGHAESWASILDAARSDPGLFDTAIHATIAHHPDAEGYLALEPLVAPTEDAHRDGMLLMAAALPVADLVAVASRPGIDPSHRQRLLTRLLEHGPSMGGRSGDPEDVARGLLLLAETGLKLGRPDQALTALDALSPALPGLDADQVLRARVIALIWTNRLEQAVALNAPVSAWLEALELAAAEPHARQILQEIRSRFGTGLTPDETARLDALARRVSTQTPETPTRAIVPSGGL